MLSAVIIAVVSSAGLAFHPTGLITGELALQLLRKLVYTKAFHWANAGWDSASVHADVNVADVEAARLACRAPRVAPFVREALAASARACLAAVRAVAARKNCARERHDGKGAEEEEAEEEEEEAEEDEEDEVEREHQFQHPKQHPKHLFSELRRRVPLGDAGHAKEYEVTATEVTAMPTGIKKTRKTKRAEKKQPTQKRKVSSAGAKLCKRTCARTPQRG